MNRLKIIWTITKSSANLWRRRPPPPILRLIEERERNGFIGRSLNLRPSGILRVVTHLGRLDRFAQKKLGVLGRRAGNLVMSLDGSGVKLSAHLRESELSVLTINLQSFWSNWCRAFYLSCAMGAQTTRGKSVSN